jgi:hypothetical protein
MWLDRWAQSNVSGRTTEDMDVVLLQMTMNCKGATFMNSTKAGRINGKSTPKKTRICVHQRMVDYHYNEKSQPSGNLVCRECGAVIPDPAKVLV